MTTEIENLDWASKGVTWKPGDGDPDVLIGKSPRLLITIAVSFLNFQEGDTAWGMELVEIETENSVFIDAYSFDSLLMTLWESI